MSTPEDTDASVTIELITPEVAARYLERNVGNRPISMNQVYNFARLMEEGKWHFNGDAIRFDTND